MNILLIGGSGFIGPPVARELQRTIAWERANPPAVNFAQFDYPAEDAALLNRTA